MNSVEIQYISTKTICPANRVQVTQQIDLTPWDLLFLQFKPIQMGLLFLSPTHQSGSTTVIPIGRLEKSLSLALDHFFPLASRFATTTHEDNTISIHIGCNNAGAEFIHATAPNVTVSDIINPVFVPRIVRAFFPLNGTINYDGRHGPLLAVQATELQDGIFIGITMNHVVVDETSFWQFVNSWSEISRTGSDQYISTHPPILHRWFLNNETIIAQFA